MPWDLIVFYLIGTVCVLAALGVVVANNPVHSAIFLVLSFFNVAAVFVMLGAEFLAVVQVIVYTGAILVLVLFVLMLVDPDDLPEFHAARPVQRSIAFLLGLILLLEVGAAILNRAVDGGNLSPSTATPQQIEAVGGNTQALGRALYTDYVFAFEVVSLVLLVGVIGAIVLALPERLGERRLPARATISLSHARGVDAALPEGPRGESPITPAREEVPAVERAPTSGGPRELIMTKDPDAYTTINRRR